MSKRLMLFAALVAALCCAGQASATVSSQHLKTSTIYNLGSGLSPSMDSSAVVNMDGVVRARLDFIAVRDRQQDAAAWDDTLCYIFVQARERLTSAAGTDSILEYPVTGNADSLALCRKYRQGVAGNPDSTARAISLHNMESQTYAAASDSTIVPWLPSIHRIITTSARPDTFYYNYTAATVARGGSTEMKVYFQAPVAGANMAYRRVASVDLVNPETAMPFTARFADFRWRLPTGTAGAAANPAVLRLRVVLVTERY